MDPTVTAHRPWGTKTILASWEGGDGAVAKISEGNLVYIRKTYFPWKLHDHKRKTPSRNPYYVESRVYHEIWRESSEKDDSKQKIRCNVPKIYDDNEQQRKIRMHYIDGQTLADLLEALPLDQFGRYQVAILRVVKTLHESGIVHNDIRGVNIIIRHSSIGSTTAELDASIFLIDFGRVYLVHQDDHLVFFRTWKHAMKRDIALLKSIFDHARRRYHSRVILGIIANQPQLNEAEQRDLVDKFVQSGCNYAVVKELLKLEGLSVETVLGLVEFMSNHGASKSAQTLVSKTLTDPVIFQQLDKAPFRSVLMLRAYSNILPCGWTEEASNSLQLILQIITDLSEPCDPTILRFRFEDVKRCWEGFWSFHPSESQQKMEALLVDLRSSREAHSRTGCRFPSHGAILKPLLEDTRKLVEQMLAHGTKFTFPPSSNPGEKRKRELGDDAKHPRDGRRDGAEPAGMKIRCDESVRELRCSMEHDQSGLNVSNRVDAP